VLYKDDKTFVELQRISDFQKMTFTKADSSVVEDIRVTLGK